MRLRFTPSSSSSRSRRRAKYIEVTSGVHAKQTESLSSSTSPWAAENAAGWSATTMGYRCKAASTMRGSAAMCSLVSPDVDSGAVSTRMLLQGAVTLPHRSFNVSQWAAASIRLYSGRNPSRKPSVPQCKSQSTSSAGRPRFALMASQACSAAVDAPSPGCAGRNDSSFPAGWLSKAWASKLRLLTISGWSNGGVQKSTAPARIAARMADVDSDASAAITVSAGSSSRAAVNRSAARLSSVMPTTRARSESPSCRKTALSSVGSGYSVSSLG